MELDSSSLIDLDALDIAFFCDALFDQYEESMPEAANDDMFDNLYPNLA